MIARLYVPLAILFSLLWASAFIAVKTGLHDSPPLFLMGSRFVIAGAILVVAALLLGNPWPAAPRAWLRLIVLGLLNYAGYLGLTVVALQTVSAGMGAVLASINPLLLAAVAPLLIAERVGRQRAIGLGVAFISVVVVMSSRLRLGTDSLSGMALILLSLVFLTAGTLLFKRWHPPESLGMLNGVQLVASGAVLLVPSLLLEPVGHLHLTVPLALSIGYLVFVVSIVAMTIWFVLLRHGDAARASSFFFLNPIFGLLLGALLLAEPLRLLDFIGSAGVGLGIFLVQRD